MVLDNLQELVNFQPSSQMLSVYLNTNPSKGNIDDFKLQLRALLKEIDLPEDVEKVRNYMELEYDWGFGQGVAVFSAEEDEFFRVIPLAVEVENQAYAMENPYLRPLISLVETYMGYGVVLIDKQQARIFAFNIGDEQEEVRFNGNEVQRHKHGGGSQVTGRSRGVEGVADDPEQTAQRNMQAVAQKAADFFRKHDVRRVILAGTEKNVSAFQNLLPKSWQSLVVGSFPMNMNAGINEIREAAWQIGYKKERRQERKVVETIVTEAAKGRNGLVRFDEILSAVKEGRVQTLALLDEIHEEGYQCQGCGYITDQELDVCPFCSDRFEHIQDAVEMTVQGVLQSGGNVKMIRESELLEEHGGIGALLRY